MERLTFTTHIHAKPHIVWDVLWDEDSYPLWTAAFGEDARMETDWKKGSQVRFLNKNDDGMLSEIADIIPEKFLSFRHLGVIAGGSEESLGKDAKQWAGAMENYTLTDEDGDTRLEVSMDIVPEYLDFFQKLWPQALEKVKALAEE
ncbi:activator of Hsp90 ATPase-like protein [Chitinophaga dinghuensis]|uniref:Activator of Hsp90 ATPase-like protein n=1 Tax=Chitinophaga dinghuensis TaxID=1539050 RepID=A0A327VQT2_9BACT|nr:SRPBCC domain-containing protein [Chitinophaga dinghuensis]RAJ77403.1 activator of Hsp90 ATPase-like protein [Chitinophaga dinghuensis]